MNKLRYINKMASLYRYATLLSSINHNLFICILVSLVLPTSERASAKVYNGQPNYDGERRLTREYHLTQGALRGYIVQPSRQYKLPNVEIFLGIPYAAPPVDVLRFMPPGSAVPWEGVKIATEFAPVCPQMLPNVHKENPPSSGRQQYMHRLIPFLKNESEDCLYLNVYVPHQENKPKKLPVLVFIHGDSFEWSSGNPYDGRILASYGRVMVVTINFRLGILGFMKPSLTEHELGNHGLLDQLAALQWIKDNIADLNGDPNSVTLMGHGTGAACVNFLMISPISNGLFHRAILMSGSALSDWALTKNPTQYTVQVAQLLNCNISTKYMMECLQSKRLDDIKTVHILAQKFATPLGPVVAGSFIPNEPHITIESYPNISSKYELMCGVTELESYHDFRVIALAHGVLETERDEILAQYTQMQYELAPEVAADDIRKLYSPMKTNPERWGVNANRDFVLDVLSDARTVAPLVQTANYHSKANPKSYFYVFGHNSEHTDYAALRKSVHGEEMPYVLGVPLGGARTHFHEEYTPKERLLSEAVMRLWTNFVKGGSPNTQRIEKYLTLNTEDWNHYNIDWPEYNAQQQSYLRIDVASSNFVNNFYRANYTKFWNEVLPEKMENYDFSPYEPVVTRKPIPSSELNRSTNWRQPPATHPQRPQVFQPTYGRPREYVPPPPIRDPDYVYREIQSIKIPARSVPSTFGEDSTKRRDSHTTKASTPDLSAEPPVKSSGATIGIIIAIGCIFLIVNIVIFTSLYLKKRRLRAREMEMKRDNNSNGDNIEASDCYPKPKENKPFEKLKTRCNELKIINWNKINRKDDKPKKLKLESSKTPKSDDSGGFRERFKLRRHLSSSTIDAHTKVRDWIANEIINRCSPPVERKSNTNMEIESKNALTRQKAYKSDEIIDKITKPPSQVKHSLNVPLNEKSNPSLSTKKSANGKEKTKTSEKTTSTSANGSQSSINNSKERIHKSNKISTSKSNDSIANSEGKISNKVSIAIDATPAARNSAILRQKPIELSKSVDILENNRSNSDAEKTVLKRSKTENDFVEQLPNSRITTDIPKGDNNLTYTSMLNFSLNDNVVKKTTPPAVIVKISHKHSSSDPVKDINYDDIVHFTDFPDIPPPSTFRNDINVTSKEETNRSLPLTAAEALLTIQRRNFPKVLPDFPKSFVNNNKRLSLQPNSFQSFRSYLNNDPSQKDNTSPAKTPPQPPLRTSSTLDRRIGFKHSKNSATSSFDSGKTSFGSICEKNIHKNDEYCNIEAISSMISEINKGTDLSHRESEPDCDIRSTYVQPVVTREFPKVIIAANDIPNLHQPKIIIQPTVEKSFAEIQTNVPRVRLPDTFHGVGPESERSGSSLSMISDVESDLDDDDEGDISDAELIEALVGGLETTFDAKSIPDTKGPDNSFEKKLEIVPVKVNTTQQCTKNYDNIRYCSDDVLPDVSDLEKTAQIKQKFSLNKLQSRSDSINQPPEKAVKLKHKKIPKASSFISKSNKDKINTSLMCKLPKQKTENKKKITLDHSYSGSSNDTESSTETVKNVEIKK